MIDLFEQIETLPIFKFKLSNDMLEKISKDVITSLQEQVDVSSSLVGAIYRGCEVLLKTDNLILEELGTQFLSKINAQVENEVKLQVSEAWTVVQKETDYNPLHVHSSFLSGVLYIKVPEFIGQIKDNRTRTCKKNEDGFIVFLNGYNFIPLKPVEGEGYIFASNVPHMVYPFTTQGTRISIAWNLDPISTGQITYR